MAVRSKIFYIYIMASRSGTLYIGVTNDIARRTYEHKHGLVAGFTSKYKVHRLVYVEAFDGAGNAIRESSSRGGAGREK